MPTDRLYPKPLLAGDTIGIVSPAGPSTADDLARGKALLESWGYLVRVFPHAGDQDGYLAGADADRLADLHSAFADPTVSVLLCARGGYGCMRLLPGLDMALIHQHPKLLIGFSDVTALLLPIYQQTGLIGLHGPMLTSNLLDGDPLTAQSLKAMVSGGFRQAGFVIHSPGQTASDYHCLQPGVATAPLIGGNLSLLAALCGTPWQPDTRGKLLFIEDWRESYYSLDRQFQQLAQAGLFQDIAGLILGDFCEIRPDAEWDVVSQFKRLCKTVRVPCGLGLPFGHGDQSITLPIGARVTFDAETGFLMVA